MARRELVAACALIGAFGGALFAFVVARPEAHEWGLVVGFALVTTFSATLLGWFLARSKCDAVEVGCRAVWGSLAAGAANGTLIYLVVWALGGFRRAELFALPLAVGYGALCAIPFVPAIVVVAMTAAYADARPGSIAHRSQGRCTVRNALVCVSVASALITPGYAARLADHLPMYAMAAAELILILLAATDFHHRARIASVGDRQPFTDDTRAERVIDYGVGLDRFMRDSRSATYREQAAAVEVHHGDPIRTCAVLASALRGHALAAAGVAVAIAATVIH